MKRFLVTWEDVYVDHGWHEIASFTLAPKVFETLAFLVSEDDDHYVFAPTINPLDETIGDPWVVPKCLVSDMKPIVFV